MATFAPRNNPTPDATLKILMVASEVAPFAKTGGLADVTGSLPPALCSLGHDVRLVMPWYPCVRKVTGSLRLARQPLMVPMGGRVYQTGYRSGHFGGVQIYFIDLAEFFDRPGLYGEEGEDYPDNAERFGLLSRAALELARRLEFVPDVVHAHDWQAGLVPVYLRQQLWRDPFFAKTGSLFSIHNLGYQGVYPLETGRELGLERSLLESEGLEYHGKLSLLKGGIRFADQVNTVSPTYCREICTPEHGMGLDGLLRARGDRLHGLLNGLDGKLWSPASDQALPASYALGQLAGKAVCKRVLQEELGLRLAPKTPLAAMITRLDSQKGIELVLESWDRLMARGLQMVILGSGNPDYQRRLSEAAAFYPEQACVLTRFDDALARRIYAGSDLFLMPSRYEPCGLGQLIALRYGSVPVVHATGGLADTIFDPEEDPQQANGFKFREYRHSSFLDGLDRALKAAAVPEEWNPLVKRGMSQDFSWAQAAQGYVKLYSICKEEHS